MLLIRKEGDKTPFEAQESYLKAHQRFVEIYVEPVKKKVVRKKKVTKKIEE